LIQALGTGMGRDVFDLGKLRYHKVIIMTDADVDGSHIRTLLLTLFFRQFPELVERGHIHIARPPLYKYKRGKVEKYLRDEKELNGFLINSSLMNCSIHVGDEIIDHEKAKSLINRFLSYKSTLMAYDGHFDTELLQRLIETERVNSDHFKSSAALSEIVEKLQKYFSIEEVKSLKRYSFAIELDKNDVESSHCVLKVSIKSPLKQKAFKLHHSFISSLEYSDLMNLHDGIKKYVYSKFEIKREQQQTRVFNCLSDFADMVLNEGRQGAYIQRYKGLGEMNPEQLWETTMNPENRVLMQVKIEDAIEADQVFSLLMGDQVAPRKEFVENNALNVKNLDI
ncbi:MAG: DNA gyrase subunit B, partial [Oligoflexia bacterium]|nr:DNA gyrase subunit B [Oligoflexia bacterium]